MAVLVRTLVRPQDLAEVYEPFYGLGSCAGDTPLGAQRLAAMTGRSAERTRWITSQTRAFAAEIGPPSSLVQGLDDIHALGVIGMPHLVARWMGCGLTRGVLHPLAVAKIARLFGVCPGFQVLRAEHWQLPLVVADRVCSGVPAAARVIRQHLRGERVLGVDQATAMAEGLAADEVRRLADACWVHVRSSDTIVDPEPYGIDRGIGRVLTGSLRPPAPLEIIEGLRRWYPHSSTKVPSWSDGQSLAAYLKASPLYDRRDGGWVVNGGWAKPAPTDLALLELLGHGDKEHSRARLVEELVDRGWSRESAEHAFAVSPVIRAPRRGVYTRIGAATQS